MIDFLTDVVTFWDGIVIWYFAGLNLFYGILFFASVLETWKNWMLASRLHLTERFEAEALPPVSIIMPAFDEEATILESLDAQLHLAYPHHEVIVVNDGSEDDTLSLLRDEYFLYEVPPAFPQRLDTEQVRGYYRSWTHPGLLVIDKENGGKADALNAGLNAARYPLCATVDADTLIDRDALPRVVRPFLIEDDVAGSGGTIRVANDCRFEGGRAVEPRLPKSYLGAIQVPEYLRAFLFGRLGWNRLGGNILVSGAFAVYRRDLLLEMGGYPTDSVTEDLDLTVRLHRHLRDEGKDYSLPFVPDPVAWTEVPEDLKSLGGQRERWQRGLIRTLSGNLGMLFNPSYGRIGTVAFPFFLFGEMLAPVVEVIGYAVVIIGLSLGLLSWEYAALFLALALGYMMLLSVWAVMLEELTYRVYPRTRDFVRMLLYAFFEPFGYRQLTLWWRLKAFWQAMVSDRRWGRHRRRGIQNGSGGRDDDDRASPEAGRPEAGPRESGSADHEDADSGDTGGHSPVAAASS
ncbi:MAG: glycosyltransferase family 2 protein [Gemmatimonadota bacterium]